MQWMIEPQETCLCDNGWGSQCAICWFWRFCWELLCRFWQQPWWFDSVGSLVRKSNKQPCCLGNVHHNSVVFIYQLAGPDGTNCVVFDTCVLFIIICKNGICKNGICCVVCMGFTPVASNTHIYVVMWMMWSPLHILGGLQHDGCDCQK